MSACRATTPSVGGLSLSIFQLGPRGVMGRTRTQYCLKADTNGEIFVLAEQQHRYGAAPSFGIRDLQLPSPRSGSSALDSEWLVHAVAPGLISRPPTSPFYPRSQPVTYHLAVQTELTPAGKVRAPVTLVSMATPETHAATLGTLAGTLAGLAWAFFVLPLSYVARAFSSYIYATLLKAYHDPSSWKTVLVPPLLSFLSIYLVARMVSSTLRSSVRAVWWATKWSLVLFVALVAYVIFTGHAKPI